MNNFVFTDIDGVFNTTNRTDWIYESLELYDKLCDEFDLKPVITSTWRVNHTKRQLQDIFRYQGITTKIHDYTPILTDEGRGREIEEWLFNNTYDKFIILDDSVRDIESCSLPNIVKCRGWIGFTEEEYELSRQILLK